MCSNAKWHAMLRAGSLGKLAGAPTTNGAGGRAHGASGGARAVLNKTMCGVLTIALTLSSVPTAVFAQEKGTANPTEGSARLNSVEEALSGYHADFTIDDLAVPEGVDINDSFIPVDHDEANAESSSSDGSSRKLVSFAGDDKDDKERKKAEKEAYSTWKRRAKSVDFAVDALEMVDKKAGKLGKYGQTFFDIVRGCATGDYAEVLYGGASLLKMLGVIEEGGKKEVSSADLKADIAELSTMMNKMAETLDETAMRAYEACFKDLYTALGLLETECDEVEAMVDNAKDFLKDERGISEPQQPKKPEMPVEPKLPKEPARPQLADEPVKSGLPAEPTKPELPAAPEEARFPEEPESPEDYYYTGDFDIKWPKQISEWVYCHFVSEYTDKRSPSLSYAMSLYEQAHAAWEKEVARIKAQHDQEVANWQAECDELTADYEKACADWQAKCDELTADYEKACADWQVKYGSLKADYEKAHDDWQKKCDELKNDYKQKKRAAQEWDEGAENVKYAAQCEEYVQQLVDFMEEQEQRGSKHYKTFKNYSTHSVNIENNYSLVCTECIKEKAMSPFSSFDSFWDLNFNWETQGYSMRQGFRTKVKDVIMRSYALIATYYNLSSRDAIEDAVQYDRTTKRRLDGSKLRNPHSVMTVKLQDALKNMSSMTAGLSPNDVDPEGPYAVRCCVNGKTAVGGSVAATGEKTVFTKDEAADYVRRLNGLSVKEDLETAGLYSPRMEEPERVDPDMKPVGGLLVSCSLEGASSPTEEMYRVDLLGKDPSHYDAMIIKWDGSIKTVRTCDRLYKAKERSNPKYPSTNDAFGKITPELRLQYKDCSFWQFNFE